MSERCQSGSCPSRATCSSGSCSTGSCPSDSSSPCSSENRLPPGILAQYDLDKPTADGSLVWLETEDGSGTEIMRSVIEIIGKIKQLDAGRIFGVVFGDAERKNVYGEAFAYGVDTIYHIRNAELNSFYANTYAEAIADVTERVNPSLIAISSTERGKEVISKVAAKLNGNVVRCNDLKRSDKGEIVVVSDDPQIPKAFPMIALIPQGSFTMPQREDGRKGTAINKPFTGKIE